MARETISVIIPYYDKWPRFKYLLQSLSLQICTDFSYEIIVIDDGSEVPLIDLAGERVHEFDGKLNIHRTMNRGRSAARNTGVQLASGQLLIFVDDDIILPPDFISKHAQAHTADADPVFVHGRLFDLPELTAVLNPETGERFPFLPPQPEHVPTRTAHLLSFHRVFQQWHEFMRTRGRLSRLEKLIECTLADPALRSCHWVGCVGGNMSVRKRTFLGTGGYDEGFRVWGGEDFELGYRLIRNGVGALYEDKIYAYHITHAHSVVKEELDESRSYFASKHKDACIDHLYDFLEKKIDDQQLIQLWKKVLGDGEDKSEACLERRESVSN